MPKAERLDSRGISLESPSTRNENSWESGKQLPLHREITSTILPIGREKLFLFFGNLPS
jgi:hypothetical protein